MIRVPDSAKGGKGKCPRCARRLTVPRQSTKIEPRQPAEQLDFLAPPDSVETPAATDPDGVVFAEAELDAEDPANLDFQTPSPRRLGEFPVEIQRSALRPGAVSSRLKKSKSGGEVWLIPAFFILLFCGVGGWYLWQQKFFSGSAAELTATTAEILELPPVELGEAYFKQPPEELQPVLEGLEKAPIRISSNYAGAVAQVQISATKLALTIQVTAGPGTAFYRVVLESDPGFANYRKENSLELEEILSSDLGRSATDFITEYRRIKEKKLDGRLINGFMQTLALPALAKGIGRELVAVQGAARYSCVYEDRDGGFYFLMPSGMQEFQVQGRTLEDGKVPFPGQYQVKVAGKIPPPPESKPATEDSGNPSKKETDDSDDAMDSEDGEMKDEKAKGKEEMKKGPPKKPE